MLVLNEQGKSANKTPGARSRTGGAVHRALAQPFASSLPLRVPPPFPRFLRKGGHADVGPPIFWHTGTSCLIY